MTEREKLIRAAAESMTVTAFCQTCGLQFLNIQASEFLKVHDWNEPDKWFVETGIHWCENDDHLILMDYAVKGMEKQNISEIWENKRKQDKLTKNIMLPHFFKYRERVKEKPI